MNAVGRRWAWRLGAFMVTTALGFAPVATGQGLLGDVNLDGDTNILDIQKTINQALVLSGATSEADIDENGAINVFDVQHTINSVLGEAGLVQRIQAQVVNFNKQSGVPLKLVAISSDGLAASKMFTSGNEVTIKLRAKNGWALGFFADDGDGNYDTLVGVVEILTDGGTSAALPVPALSVGQALDLGVLTFEGKAAVTKNVNTLIADMAAPLDTTDADGNGLADFVDDIVEAVIDTPQVPNSVDVSGLQIAVGACLDAQGADLTKPDATDTDGNGVPDFLEPVVTCIEQEVPNWFPGQGFDPPNQDSDGNGRPDIIDAIIETVVAAVPGILDGLGRPEFDDANNNHIPDFAEAYVALNGVPSSLDTNGDGVPDFAEDDDGDGIPNIADTDARTPEDSDGDGIPNVADVDDDNDGTPDYADADPTDPAIS